jgi:hypothetical protein
MRFQVNLMENLVSKYHIAEDRPFGSPPETAPPTRMNAAHYPSYIAASLKAKSMSVLCYVLHKWSTM